MWKRHVFPLGRLGIAAVLLASVAGRTAHAEIRPWELSSSITYVTGDYGTDVDSDLVYIPVILQRNTDRWKASVTVPWLWIENSGDVTIVGGVPEGGGDVGFKQTHSGLGDVRLQGTYFAWFPGELKEWAPGIDLSADLKLPTADEDKGLGTGETDLGFAIGLYDWLSRKWLWFADWKYKFIGEPADRDYDNQVIYDIGVAYKPREEWLHSFLLEERTAVTDAGEESVSAVYAPRYEVESNLDVYGSVEVGLSDGAPDYSLTAGFEYGF